MVRVWSNKDQNVPQLEQNPFYPPNWRPVKLSTRHMLACVCVCWQQKAVKSAAVERLTDTSKYTGSHKERFDEEGKGRGVAGRKEVYDHAGYVQGYKEQDSYDKSH